MAFTTINKPGEYFNTKLYAGDGQSTHAITGVGFQPDWVWIKKRNGTGSHNLVDAVRGVQNAIATDDTSAQGTYSNNLSAFGTDGFTVGSGSLTNDNGYNFVSWNWRAGAGQGSSNTDGSINTTYTSVNTTGGFSISQYTGTGANATVGHGLGVAPKMIIIKCTSHTSNWAVYHKSIGATKMLNLNSTNAEATNNGYFNDTDPTNLVFSLGDEGNDTNGSGKTYIAYCFAEKTGYSKFSDYTGNGSAEGAFVYTGFKPAFVLVKRNEAGYSWGINDSKRPGYNETDKYLIPDTNASDQTNAVDLVSNGFKFRTTAGGFNGSASYIYMAFAAEPLVASNGDPATAR